MEDGVVPVISGTWLSSEVGGPIQSAQACCQVCNSASLLLAAGQHGPDAAPHGPPGAQCTLRIPADRIPLSRGSCNRKRTPWVQRLDCKGLLTP